MFICIVINLKTRKVLLRKYSNACYIKKNNRIGKGVNLGIIFSFLNANIMIKIISRSDGISTHYNNIVFLTANAEACSHINLFAFSKHNSICHTLVNHPRIVINTTYLLVGLVIVKVLSSLTLNTDTSGMLVASCDSSWNS